MPKDGRDSDGAIGARIRSARRHKDLTQTELADLLGLTFQQVQKYEKGTNSVPSDRVIRLCLALDITPNWLFGFEAEGQLSLPLLKTIEPPQKIDLVKILGLRHGQDN